MRDGDWQSQFEYDPSWNMPVPGICELAEAIDGVKPLETLDATDTSFEPSSSMWGSRGRNVSGSYYPPFQKLLRAETGGTGEHVTGREWFSKTFPLAKHHKSPVCFTSLTDFNLFGS